MYAIREIFPSIQGEGHHTGRPCVFVRFSGCNVWSGIEAERAEGVKRGGCAAFCDTIFHNTKGVNGGRLEDQDIVNRAKWLWLNDKIEARWIPKPYVVFTGGEPTIQLEQPLVDAFKNMGWEVAIETNGSNEINLTGIDWITVSPKPPKRVKLKRANEVKCLYPDVVQRPEDYAYLAPIRYVQPIDHGVGITPQEQRRASLQALAHCVNYALDNPPWDVSIQVHKLIGKE